GVDLQQEAWASRDAIRFLYCVDEPDLELRAYRTLFPAYSTYVGSYGPGAIGFGAATVLLGHITGRTQARVRSRSIGIAPQPSDLLRPGWCEPLSNGAAHLQP